LEWVQVHPTGLVKPDDADAKIKFLAAEVPNITAMLQGLLGRGHAQQILTGPVSGLARGRWYHFECQGRALLQ